MQKLASTEIVYPPDGFWVQRSAIMATAPSKAERQALLC